MKCHIEFGHYAETAERLCEIYNAMKRSAPRRGPFHSASMFVSHNAWPRGVKKTQNGPLSLGYNVHPMLWPE